MKCEDIIAVLEELSPPSFAMEWDNSGLLVGDRMNEVERVLIAVDATDEVIDEAIRVGADMLLTHHPLIFGKINRVCSDDLIGRRILKLAENKIVLYCMHTNFDVMGMADAAAEEIELVNSSVLEVTYEDEISKEGIGRFGKLRNPQNLETIAEFVKGKFRLPFVTVYGDLEKEIEIAAISTGSGKSMIPRAIEKKCDVIITGDIDYHTALDAVSMGLCIIDAGHFGLEKIFIPYIADYLKRELPSLDAIKSTQTDLGRKI